MAYSATPKKTDVKTNRVQKPQTDRKTPNRPVPVHIIAQTHSERNKIFILLRSVFNSGRSGYHGAAAACYASPQRFLPALLKNGGRCRRFVISY
ncbi:MAG: hypothetical protein IJJ99_08055 [Oscillospiraceae bacterium]|nr:hypothetical protein [Oscillospiraceae bacterium]